MPYFAKIDFVHYETFHLACGLNNGPRSLLIILNWNVNWYWWSQSFVHPGKIFPILITCFENLILCNHERSLKIPKILWNILWWFCWGYIHLSVVNGWKSAKARIKTPVFSMLHLLNIHFVKILSSDLDQNFSEFQIIWACFLQPIIFKVTQNSFILSHKLVFCP